jgi:hypothetical protein
MMQTYNKKMRLPKFESFAAEKWPKREAKTWCCKKKSLQ